MAKRISLILSVVMLLSLFFIPVAAEETITDLKKVYNNLQTYLYTPYYKDSEKYEAYSQKMDEVKELLSSDAITQAEISKYYNELRVVYADLMKDTYDYSSLDMLIESYNALDSSIFTEESWKKVLSVRDSVSKELSSPTLFSRKTDTTSKQYADYIQKHIATFTTDFSNAFNELVLIERPEEMTKSHLSAYTKYIRFCAREELLQNAPSWGALQEAFENADYALGLTNPRQSRLENAFDDIETYYNTVCSEAYAFTEAKDAVAKYKESSAEKFSSASWKRYADEIALLEAELAAPHLFFIPLHADEETCKEFAENYQKTLALDAEELFNALVPMESFSQLSSLCAKYKEATTMEGLEIKLNLLLKRVKEGEAVLSNDLASKADVETAISNINTAVEDLELAEKHLTEEQGKVVKQDAKTIQLTVIFTATALILSLIFAVVLSRYHLGKVNWTR